MLTAIWETLKTSQSSRPLPISVVLKLQHTLQSHLEGFLKHRLLDSTFWCQGDGLRICIFNRFLDDADADGPAPHFENHCSNWLGWQHGFTLKVTAQPVEVIPAVLQWKAVGGRTCIGGPIRQYLLFTETSREFPHEHELGTSFNDFH